MLQHSQRQLELVEIDPPKLSPQLSSEYQDSVQMLQDHPHWFNGPKLICLKVEERACVYRTDYATNTLIHQYGEKAGLGLGPVWAGAVFYNMKGQLLLTKRSPEVFSYAGLWTFPTGGGMIPGEDPYRAMSRELKEEWGEDIVHGTETPEFLATVWGQVPESAGLGFVWKILVRDDSVFDPDPSETAEWKWCKPDRLPQPLGSTTKEIFQLPGLIPHLSKG